VSVGRGGVTASRIAGDGMRAMRTGRPSPLRSAAEDAFWAGHNGDARLSLLRGVNGDASKTARGDASKARGDASKTARGVATPSRRGVGGSGQSANAKGDELASVWTDAGVVPPLWGGARGESSRILGSVGRVPRPGAGRPRPPGPPDPPGRTAVCRCMPAAPGASPGGFPLDAAMGGVIEGALFMCGFTGRTPVTPSPKIGAPPATHGGWMRRTTPAPKSCTTHPRWH
jgi:hypothetical protein